jgi:hypothetical protein
VALFLGITAGGLSLQLGETRGDLLATFALIFTVAAASRAFSSLMLYKKTEPLPPASGWSEMSIRDALRQTGTRTDRRFLVYLLAVQLTVSIAGPFFTPYMLRTLELSYGAYMALLATSFLAKIAVLPLIGNVARRRGPQWLLRVGGLGIVPLPALWLVSHSYAYLLVLQVLAGCVWASYELGVFLLVFERVPVSKRTAVLTVFNVAHALMTVTGSLIGAALFHLPGPFEAYLLIFAVSALARAITIPLQFKLQHMPSVSWPMVFRSIAVRPSAGTLWRPLFAALSNPRLQRGRPRSGDSEKMDQKGRGASK